MLGNCLWRTLGSWRGAMTLTLVVFALSATTSTLHARLTVQPATVEVEPAPTFAVQETPSQETPQASA